MAYGFLFDATRCTGCKTCVLACKDAYDLRADAAYRQVYEYGGGGWSRDDQGCWSTDSWVYYLSVACNHCLNAVCVQVCPTGAMHADEDGLVGVDTHRCVGCGYCELACPYHAPRVDRELGHCVKCDGCSSRVRDGRPPVCVESCPQRALGFGDYGDLARDYGTFASIAPLPDVTVTLPHLVVVPPPHGRQSGSDEGALLNLDELV